MRKTLSIVVSLIVFGFVVWLILAGSVNLPMYWTEVAAGLTLIGIGVLYWGFKPDIVRWIKGKKETIKKELPLPISNNNKPTEKLSKPYDEKQLQTGEKVIKKGILLPDNNEIVKLNVANSFLDELYEKARSKATESNNDAKLSYFSIQVYPFLHEDYSLIPFIEIQSTVRIYMYFYSKWGNKIHKFRYIELEQRVEKLPDEPPMSDWSRKIFAKVPWRKNPHWMQFLGKAYAKVKALPVSEGTGYQLMARAYNKEMPWKIMFEDGLGNRHTYGWNGRGLDENSITVIEK